jgi:hypothetical protein
MTANGNGTIYVLRLEEAPTRGSFPPLDPAWLAKVRAMKPEEQVQAVVAELKRRNPGFDGKVTPTIQDSEVVSLKFEERVQIRDLMPLQGLPLKALHLENSGVNDLSSLQGIPLQILVVRRPRLISDLSPLQGMPLKYLAADNSGLTDLTPLKGIKLTNLQQPGRPS